MDSWTLSSHGTPPRLMDLPRKPRLNIVEDIYKNYLNDFTICSIVDFIGGGWIPVNITGQQRSCLKSLASHFVLTNNSLYALGDEAAIFDVKWQSVNGRQVLISWACVPDYVKQLCQHVVINVVDEKAPAGHPGKSFYVPFNQMTFPVSQLKTGSNFIVRVEYRKTIRHNDGRTFELVIGSGKCSVRAMFSFNEVVKLGTMAADYVRDHNERKGLQPIEVFYRNKPREYYNDIMENYGWIMYPYMKDFNGDPGSPINGNILGLFFSGKLDPRTKKLPEYSPFGNTRLQIPAERLVLGMNLYFADFYCHYMQHYVTIVAAVPQSTADLFCSQHLPLLNPYTNPFVRIGGGGYSINRVQICTRVLVELFYTSQVDINFHLNTGGQLGTISKTLGRGVSRLEGIVKNPYCNVCALYPPMKRPREESEETGKKPASDSAPVKPLIPPTERKTPLKAKRKNKASSAAGTLASSKENIRVPPLIPTKTPVKPKQTSLSAAATLVSSPGSALSSSKPAHSQNRSGTGISGTVAVSKGIASSAAFGKGIASSAAFGKGIASSVAGGKGVAPAATGKAIEISSDEDVEITGYEKAPESIKIDSLDESLEDGELREVSSSKLASSLDGDSNLKRPSSVNAKFQPCTSTSSEQENAVLKNGGKPTSTAVKTVEEITSAVLKKVEEATSAVAAIYKSQEVEDALLSLKATMAKVCEDVDVLVKDSPEWIPPPKRARRDVNENYLKKAVPEIKSEKKTGSTPDVHSSENPLADTTAAFGNEGFPLVTCITPIGVRGITPIKLSNETCSNSAVESKNDVIASVSTAEFEKGLHNLDSNQPKPTSDDSLELGDGVSEFQAKIQKLISPSKRGIHAEAGHNQLSSKSIILQSQLSERIDGSGDAKKGLETKGLKGLATKLSGPAAEGAESQNVEKEKKMP